MIDSTILDVLRGSMAERDDAIREIARAPIRDAIIAYVVSMGGSQEEALTVFHDSIIGLVKRAVKYPDFVTDSLDAYLMGIAKYRCYDMFKARQTAVSGIDEVYHLSTDDPTALQLIMDGERGLLIRKVLDALRTRCREVLLHWASGYKMAEIAALVGYKSDMMARKKKSECLKQLYLYLGDRPHLTRKLRGYE